MGKSHPQQAQDSRMQRAAGSQHWVASPQPGYNPQFPCPLQPLPTLRPATLPLAPCPGSPAAEQGWAVAEHVLAQHHGGGLPQHFSNSSNSLARHSCLPLGPSSFQLPHPRRGDSQHLGKTSPWPQTGDSAGEQVEQTAALCAGMGARMTTVQLVTPA